MLEKEVIVYWAPISFPYLLDVERAAKDIHDRVQTMSKETPIRSSIITKCPVVMNHLYNTFVVKSPITLRLEHDKGRFRTLDYDQEFFDKNVLIRDRGSKLLSLGIGCCVFFTEEKSLDMEIRSADYGLGDFACHTSVLGGVIDIGNYFRFLDLAFFMNTDRLYINSGESLYYVKFHTKKKVRLVKFHLTDEINNLHEEFLTGRHKITHDLNLKTNIVKNKMDEFYFYFNRSKYKSLIINKIKRNLME